MKSAALIVLTLLVVAPPARALDTLGRDRGWTLGLGFGMGRADVQYQGGSIEEKLREGVNTEWRIGKVAGWGMADLPWILPRVNRQFSFTFDYQGWLLEDGDLNRFSARFRQGLQIWGLGITWYPGNPEVAWGGIVIRASAGPALANVAITVLDEDLIEDEEVRLDEWGWGLGLSAGYEFFVADSIAFGPMLNWGRLNIDEDIHEFANWLTLTLLGSWYF